MFFPLRATSEYSKEEIISICITENINNKTGFFLDYKVLSNISWDSVNLGTKKQKVGSQ